MNKTTTLREGDQTESPKPPSRWDHPAVVVGTIAAFWTVVVIAIIGIEIAFGVSFS